jgi:hypothetical protein
VCAQLCWSLLRSAVALALIAGMVGVHLVQSRRFTWLAHDKMGTSRFAAKCAVVQAS